MQRQKADVSAAFCLLPSAFCLLPSAFCLLPSAFCLLPSAFCLLPSAFCLLPSAFCLLPSAFCLLLKHRPRLVVVRGVPHLPAPGSGLLGGLYLLCHFGGAWAGVVEVGRPIEIFEPGAVLGFLAREALLGQFARLVDQLIGAARWFGAVLLAWAEVG